MLAISTSKVLMQVVQAVTESRCKPESVEDRVEEACVAKVCEAGNTGANGPDIAHTPTIHIAATHSRVLWSGSLMRCSLQNI